MPHNRHKGRPGRSAPSAAGPRRYEHAHHGTLVLGLGFLENSKPVDCDTGQFYVIALIPEFSQGRLKLGFATNVSERLSQHRTASPTAKLMKYWPSKKPWERAAMDALTWVECELVANEVFECSDVTALFQRGDKFFANMPAPAYRLPLSKESPLEQED